MSSLMKTIRTILVHNNINFEPITAQILMGYSRKKPFTITVNNQNQTVTISSTVYTGFPKTNRAAVFKELNKLNYMQVVKHRLSRNGNIIMEIHICTRYSELNEANLMKSIVLISNAYMAHEQCMDKLKNNCSDE